VETLKSPSKKHVLKIKLKKITQPSTLGYEKLGMELGH